MDKSKELNTFAKKVLEKVLKVSFDFVMIMQPKDKDLIKHVVETVVSSKEFGDKTFHAHAVMLDTCKRFAEVLFDEANLAKKI